MSADARAHPASSTNGWCAAERARPVSRLDVPGDRPEELRLFRPLPGPVPPRDLQDLMAYPFFALGKTHRATPIGFRAGAVTTRVEGTAEHGIATIWDADVLIWATSHIVAARDAGLPTSRLLVATPYEILRFAGRGLSLRDYQRLRSALDRLQSTTVATSLRQPTGRRLHRFSWLNEWRECVDPHGKPLGLELILPDWFYQSLLDPRQVLSIHPDYFRLTGGIERWLYRLVRKHGGRQTNGWRFDFEHLYAKSGSSARYRDFAGDLRRIARQGRLPGYELSVVRAPSGRELLAFAAADRDVSRQMRALAERLRAVNNL